MARVQRQELLPALISDVMLLMLLAVLVVYAKQDRPSPDNKAGQSLPLPCVTVTFVANDRVVDQLNASPMQVLWDQSPVEDIYSALDLCLDSPEISRRRGGLFSKSLYWEVAVEVDRSFTIMLVPVPLPAGSDTYRYTLDLKSPEPFDVEWKPQAGIGTNRTSAVCNIKLELIPTDVRPVKPDREGSK